MIDRPDTDDEEHLRRALWKGGWYGDRAQDALVGVGLAIQRLKAYPTTLGFDLAPAETIDTLVTQWRDEVESVVQLCRKYWGDEHGRQELIGYLDRRIAALRAAPKEVWGVFRHWVDYDAHRELEGLYVRREDALTAARQLPTQQGAFKDSPPDAEIDTPEDGVARCADGTGWSIERLDVAGA